MEKTSKDLVTGANGHVGFNLVQMLLEDGYNNLRVSVRDKDDPTPAPLAATPCCAAPPSHGSSHVPACACRPPPRARCPDMPPNPRPGMCTKLLSLATVMTLALAGCATPPPPAVAARAAASASPSPSAARLHAVFDAVWEDTMRRHPERATYLGDNRYGDQLEDASPAAEAAHYAARQQHLRSAQAIDTTSLSPQQIHAIGLREVARLQGDIAQVTRDMAWQGDFASFVRHLNADPKYFHTSPQALLAGQAPRPCIPPR
jgi:hypothetical protein